MFDADGVLQHLPGGWIAAAEPFFGGRALEFLQRSYAAELPTLAGQGDHLAILTAPLAVVRAVREGGYGVHLGSNQERYRAAHMREVLGYDGLFDVSCYSWELGAAKPDLAFFTEAARRIGAEPSAILFIDDNAHNVAAARVAGLTAERWCIDDGHDVLGGLLARHGVTV